MNEEIKDGKSYDRNYLHEMYNATSTDDGEGDLETYEFWLEKQLLRRLSVIEDLQSENKRLREENQILRNTVHDYQVNWITERDEEIDRLREELEEAIRILKFLTELRDHKAINGKDDFYNNNRHLAWYDADIFLSKNNKP